MRTWIRTYWWLLKALLVLGILVAIGRLFWQYLESADLRNRPLRPAWLVLSGALYLVGLGFSAWYWYGLLRLLGQRPSFWAAMRAHYVGQLGKYLPGKAWALFLRSGLVRGPEVRVSIAILTSFYEVLMTMATGALLAALLFTLQARDFSSVPDRHAFRRLLPRAEPTGAAIDPKVLAVLSLVLLLVIGIAVVPPVFNWLGQRLMRPFRQKDAAPLPRIRMSCLLEGPVVTSGCWLMMGASVWALLKALMDEPPAWGWETWARCTAYIALAYVAGFVILWLPSGIGVREFFLLLMLIPVIVQQQPGVAEKEATTTAALAVLLLRLVWTVAEGLMIGIVYWLPVQSTKDEC